jgi:hypothetical protein
MKRSLTIALATTGLFAFGAAGCGTAAQPAQIHTSKPTATKVHRLPGQVCGHTSAGYACWTPKATPKPKVKIVYRPAPTPQPTHKPWHPQPTPKPVYHAPSTPAPQPTQNPWQGAATYRADIEQYAPILQADASSLSTDCGNEDLSACAGDAQQLSTDAQQWLNDLTPIPTPPILAQNGADQALGNGIRAYIQAGSDCYQGLTNTNIPQADQGVSEIKTANADIQNATSLIDQAVAQDPPQS